MAWFVLVNAAQAGTEKPGIAKPGVPFNVPSNLDLSTWKMSALTGQAKTPLVTIAIPTRNRAPLLRDCVASALAQTYPDIEVLVSNNASTDNTSEVLSSFGDPRVRELRNKENIGLTPNWNQCVNEARGEYLVIASDDNLLAPTFLEKCVLLVNEEPGLSAVVGTYDILIEAENRTIAAVISKRLKTGIWDGTAILVEHLRGHLSCGTLSAAIRTDILRRLGGFPREYPGSGEELVLAQILLGKRAGLINECCASHVFHTHPTRRQSAEVDIDSRFIELYDAMQAVVDVAANEETREELRRETQTFVWHRALHELAFSRQGGSSFAQAIRHLWSWRTLLAQGGLVNVVTALRLRLLGRILLPASLIRAVRLQGGT